MDGLPTLIHIPSDHDTLPIHNLEPDHIAAWFLMEPLTEVLKLQTELAKRGVCLTVSTPEIHLLQE